MAEQSKDDVLSVIIQIVSEESGVAARTSLGRPPSLRTSTSTHWVC